MTNKQQKNWNKVPENKKRKQIYDVQYREVNREKINKRVFEKLKNCPEAKLRKNLRNRLIQAIKQGRKKGSAVKDLGCSIEFFKKYIESKFSPGMTWDNWGRAGWHLDHIIPLSSFNLSNRKDFLVAVNYKNIQPLWSLDNIKKGNKIP